MTCLQWVVCEGQADRGAVGAGHFVQGPISASNERPQTRRSFACDAARSAARRASSGRATMLGSAGIADASMQATATGVRTSRVSIFGGGQVGVVHAERAKQHTQASLCIVRIML